MAKVITVQLEVDEKGAVRGIKNTEGALDKTKDSAKDTGKAMSGLEQQADRLTGGLISGFKKVTAGVKTSIGAFKSLKVAIAATGIGLLVVAFSSLAAALTTSEEGQNKLNKIMGVFGALVGNLVDLLADLGEGIIAAVENPKKAIADFGNFIKDQVENRITGLLELIPNLGKAIKLVFEGEFEEAGKVAVNAMGKVTIGVEEVTTSIQNATEATKEFIKEQEREARAAARVADMRAQADKIDRQLTVERSKLESEVADLRLKARQEQQFSEEERKKFLLDANRIQDDLLNKEKEALELRRDAQVLENTFSRSNKENLDKEAEAIAAVNRIDARRKNQQRQIQRELNTLENQLEADRKARAAEAQKRSEEEIKALNEIKEATLNEQELEIKAVEDKYDRLIMLAIQYNQDTIELERERQQRIAAIQEEAYLAEQEAFFQRAAAEQEREQSEKQNQEQGIDDIIAAAMAENIERERLAEQSAQKQIQIEKAAADAKLTAIQGALGVVSQLVNEQSAAGKALAVAGATIDTFRAATNALANTPAPPPVPQIAAGSAIAFGLLQVRKILSTKLPGAANGRGGGGGGSAPSAPSVGSAISIANPATGAQEIGEELRRGRNEPIKAYTIGQDVTNQQQLDDEIVANGTFG